MWLTLAFLFLTFAALSAVKAIVEIETINKNFATSFRTALIWAISFEILFAIAPPCVFIFYDIVASFWSIAMYIFLANAFLTDTVHDEVSEFTATFSGKNWLFLFLSFVSSIAVRIFLYCADLQFELGKMFIAVCLVLLPLIGSTFFFKEPYSTTTFGVLFAVITCVVMYYSDLQKCHKFKDSD